MKLMQELLEPTEEVTEAHKKKHKKGCTCKRGFIGFCPVHGFNGSPGMGDGDHDADDAGGAADADGDASAGAAVSEEVKPKCFEIFLMGNWYDGKYYSYTGRSIFVPANTIQEAMKWVRRHKAELLAYFELAKRNGHRLLPTEGVKIDFTKTHPGQAKDREPSTCVQAIINHESVKESLNEEVAEFSPISVVDKDQGRYLISVKETSGIMLSVMRSIAYSLVDYGRSHPDFKLLTKSLLPMEGNRIYSGKFNGFIAVFKTETPAKAESVIDGAISDGLKSIKAELKRAQARKDSAPERKKEAAKYAANDAKKKKEELEKQFGKGTAARFSTRQVGGDDGYCYALFDNGRKVRGGMTRSEAAFAKQRAMNNFAKENKLGKYAPTNESIEETDMSINEGFSIDNKLQRFQKIMGLLDEKMEVIGRFVKKGSTLDKLSVELEGDPALFREAVAAYDKLYNTLQDLHMYTTMQHEDHDD